MFPYFPVVSPEKFSFSFTKVLKRLWSGFWTCRYHIFYQSCFPQGSPSIQLIFACHLGIFAFFYPFCCLFLDKVSACFTSHFHQKVIYFLFCPCFSLIMCYQCLCFRVTSCWASRSNKQNEIKPGGEELIRDGWPDSFWVFPLRAEQFS